MRAPPPKALVIWNERSNRHHDPKPPNSMFCDRCAAAEFATKVTNPTRRTSRFIGLLPRLRLGGRQQDRVQEQLEGAVCLAPELRPKPEQDHTPAPAAYRCLPQRRFPNEPLLVPDIAGSQGLRRVRRQGPRRGRNGEGGAILEVDLEGVGDPDGNRATRPFHPPQNRTENRAWGVKSQNLWTRCLPS